jgi:hypothetical protein
MQDFRDTPQYKTFESCRLNQSKYLLVLDSFADAKGVVSAPLKVAAIDAMAYNENCDKAGADLSNTVASSKVSPVFEVAYQSYKTRVSRENFVLAALISGDRRSLSSALTESITSVAAERVHFSQVSEFQQDLDFPTIPFWVIAVAAILVFAGIRGYLKRDQTIKPVGLTRFSVDIFKSLFKGVKDDVKSFSNVNKNKDKPDVQP